MTAGAFFLVDLGTARFLRGPFGSWFRGWQGAAAGERRYSDEDSKKRRLRPRVHLSSDNTAYSAAAMASQMRSMA